jgi:hypothetical protein
MSTSVTLLPITDNDVDRVARFLTASLNPAVPAEVWAAGIRAPWARGTDHGCMLIADEEIVGVNLAFRSVREIGGRTEHICNLGALCVLPEHRAHAPRLIRAILKGPGVSYTDLSPSGNVVAINERLKMVPLDTRTRLLPNLPSLPKKNLTLSTKDSHLRTYLKGEGLVIYEDHASAPAVRHLLLRVGDRCCHIMWRHDRRKGVRAFATILYVSDRDLFHAFAPQVLGHLLTQHVPFTLLEERVATANAFGGYWNVRRPKMFKSASLEPTQIDYLYSELTQIPW